MGYIMRIIKHHIITTISLIYAIFIAISLLSSCNTLRKSEHLSNHHKIDMSRVDSIDIINKVITNKDAKSVYDSIFRLKYIVIEEFDTSKINVPLMRKITISNTDVKINKEEASVMSSVDSAKIDIVEVHNNIDESTIEEKHHETKIKTNNLLFSLGFCLAIMLIIFLYFLGVKFYD